MTTSRVLKKVAGEKTFRVESGRGRGDYKVVYLFLQLSKNGY